MHQTLFEHLCIFCPLYDVFQLILQRKEILCLYGEEHLFHSNISSCWQRITVCLAQTNSEIPQ